MAVARTAVSKLLASKSVHVRIQPKPASLSETREILRVLQRFGDIVVFKHLRVCGSLDENSLNHKR